MGVPLECVLLVRPYVTTTSEFVADTRDESEFKLHESEAAGGTTVPHYAAGCATTSFSCAAPAAAGTATCAPCAPCVETAARPSRLRQRGVQAAAGGHQRPEFLEEDTVVRAPNQELEWRAVVTPA